MPDPMWTLDQGVTLVKALQQPSRQFGYHVAIGGGVVNSGISYKDVDIYFLPLDNDKVTYRSADLVEWLETMWGKSKPINDPSYITERPSQYAFKLKFFRSDGTRIDVFIV